MENSRKVEWTGAPTIVPKVCYGIPVPPLHFTSVPALALTRRDLVATGSADVRGGRGAEPAAELDPAARQSDSRSKSAKRGPAALADCQLLLPPPRRRRPQHPFCRRSARPVLLWCAVTLGGWRKRSGLGYPVPVPVPARRRQNQLAAPFSPQDRRAGTGTGPGFNPVRSKMSRHRWASAMVGIGQAIRATTRTRYFSGVARRWFPAKDNLAAVVRCKVCVREGLAD
eukprot:COSAG04_NODE_2019_length_4991_cov_8.639002_1_plen_227_part_00